ncbi:hypothetical protein DPMN_054803 [Dreissena polymorpha]|uniref:C2H2-type domain-containing protein n=1 Tax=Dreissena polymorpha TaxID=45954 RepID=A0A9D4CRG1_DREPO|nr:hypothetical protein DPMN_054803 [Dreissena polymorpha]
MPHKPDLCCPAKCGNRVFRNRKKVRRHFLKEHRLVDMFCSTCKKQFYSRQAFQDHETKQQCGLAVNELPPDD